jgi:hypothetical protein
VYFFNGESQISYHQCLRQQPPIAFRATITTATILGKSVVSLLENELKNTLMGG